LQESPGNEYRFLAPIFFETVFFLVGLVWIVYCLRARDFSNFEWNLSKYYFSLFEVFVSALVDISPVVFDFISIP